MGNNHNNTQQLLNILSKFKVFVICLPGFI